MMKKMNYYENLSAYADNELPPDVKKETERELESSVDLQNKLDEYKRIKNLTAKVKRAPESPYFEARLYESIKDKNRTSLKAWRNYYPAIGIGVLTVILMFVFKFNTKDINNLIDKQRFNIVDLYAKNLKPILYSSDVTKEDIFNFAFYNELPLNKENNQYLALGTEKNGNSYFEIKNASFSRQTNNLEKFMNTLNLNQRERKQVDSILEGYINDLRPQILANEKNTIAINSNLINMNKAIAADLMNFAQNVNQTALNQMIPAAYRFTSAPAVNQMIKKVKNNNDEDTYIFITPDTIFSEQYRYDMKGYEKELKKMQRELEKGEKSLKNLTVIPNMPKLNNEVFINLNKELSKLKKHNKLKLNNKDLTMFFDSNYCKIEIPKFEFPDFELPNFDSIASEIEKATSQFRNFTIDDGVIILKRDGKGLKFKNRKDSLRVYGYKNMPFFDPRKPMDLRALDSLKGRRFGNLSVFGDSIGNVFQNIFTDSMTVYDQKALKEQMQMMKEQMKRFQKELQRMQEDMQNIPSEKKEKKKKAPIEINSKRYYINKIAPIIV